MHGLRFALLPRFLVFSSQALILVGALGLSACASPPGEAWAAALRPDFSSPESAGRSFLAAWAVKEPKTEYLALSEEWKAELGASYDAYLLARPQLAHEIGWTVKHAWRLQPVAEERVNDEIWIWWGLDDEALLGIRFVQQHYFEFRESGTDGRRPGSYIDMSPSELLELDGSSVYLEFSDPLVRSVRGFQRELQSFEVGSEWKIRGLLQVEEPADSGQAVGLESPDA